MTSYFNFSIKKNLSKAFFKLLSFECNNSIGYNFSTLVPLSNLNIDFVTHLENADFLNMENWEELALKRKVERPQSTQISSISKRLTNRLEKISVLQQN